MDRFAHARAEQVYETGLCEGVPKHVSRRGHWIMHLLLAAHGMQDVGVIGRIARWRNSYRLGLRVDGKWFVTFEWENLCGATEIRIERL